jgi:putative spermidine/putrescine transport system permease protein
MAAVADYAGTHSLASPGPQPATGTRVKSRPAYWRWIVLLLAAGYFLLPLYAAVRFTIRATDGHTTAAAYRGITHQPGFTDALTLSLKLAGVTVAITLVLLVPTVVYLHLRLPKLRRVVEAICLLPIVIPPVVLIVGVLQVAPMRLKATPYLLALEYVVLALPFAYRSLDAGLAAIDLRTLVDAARSLGSGWVSTLMRVVLPNMRSAVMSATVLTAALVLGEFTLASLDQYQTFPVWVVAFDQDDARVSVAVSLLALVLTWVFLLLLSALDVRRARKVKTPLDPTTMGETA